MTEQETIAELAKDVAAWEQNARAWQSLAHELDKKLREALALLADCRNESGVTK